MTSVNRRSNAFKSENTNQEVMKLRNYQVFLSIKPYFLSTYNVGVSLPSQVVCSADRDMITVEFKELAEISVI